MRPKAQRETPGRGQDTSTKSDVLLAKGYEVHYQQFVRGDDYLSWRGTFADGLMDLIGTTKTVP